MAARARGEPQRAGEARAPAGELDGVLGVPGKSARAPRRLPGRIPDQLANGLGPGGRLEANVGDDRLRHGDRRPDGEGCLSLGGERADPARVVERHQAPGPQLVPDLHVHHATGLPAVGAAKGGRIVSLWKRRSSGEGGREQGAHASHDASEREKVPAPRSYILRPTSRMPRFKLTIEYAGTRYRGWQIQKNARSVQGELAGVIREVCGRGEFELYGSGRTDAGVHALAQVAHLDLETPRAPEALRLALNDALPPDIHVLALERVARRFHARHGAVARSYLYQVSRRRTALAKPYVWWVKDTLDLARMRRASEAFIGMHDFRSFTDSDPAETSTRVLLERLELAEEGELILFRLLGSHFLWKMVRRIIGVLAEVGRGGLEVRQMSGLLDADSDVPARLTAPPS